MVSIHVGVAERSPSASRSLLIAAPKPDAQRFARHHVTGVAHQHQQNLEGLIAKPNRNSVFQKSP
jgi:hypothetical protein